MLDTRLARRLVRWGTRGALLSLGLLAVGATLAYAIGDPMPFSIQFAGHFLIGVAGLGLKSGYIVRLVGLDVLMPYTEGGA